jgi:hypothetical protein
MVDFSNSGSFRPARTEDAGLAPAQDTVGFAAARLPGAAMITWATIEELVTELEDLQRRKVLDLARRLRPGLTLEDVRNPHDFPELDDPDWQHSDGILVGIQSVLAAVRARQREDDAPSGPDEGNGPE